MGATLALGAAFSAGCAAAVIAIWLAARAVLRQLHVEDTRDLAGAVAFRIAGLHGLILGLVFAGQLGEYRDLRGELVREASALADIHADAGRHGPDADPIRPLVERYLAEVARAEWASMAAGEGLTPAAWAAWDGIYAVVLDLPEGSPRQASLRAHMLEDVRAVAALRDARVGHGGAGGPTALFWWAAAAGLALVAATFLTWPATVLNGLLIGAFGAYAGGVAFLIWAVSDPYAPPGMLGPAPIEALSATLAAGR